MTRPLVHPAAEQVYRLLPDFMRSADEIDEIDYTALRYVAGASVGLERAADFLTIVDPDTSVSGTCELVNAAACPRAFLGWLGWLVGIDISGISDPFVRDAITNASATQRRGSRQAIQTAVERTLTGGRSVRIYWNASGSDPYLITVVTITGQTPDAVTTLEAAVTEKPAALDLEVQVVSGSVYTEIAAGFATYQDVANEFPTYSDMSAYQIP